MMDFNGRIVSCKCLFDRPGSPDYEALGFDKVKAIEEGEPCDFRFDILEISTYNESSSPKFTTLRLKNGDSFNLAVSFKEFDDFIWLRLNK